VGYRFSGFFINESDPELVQAIRTRWPLVQAQPVRSPFIGYGFVFPNHERCTSDQQAEPILEQRFSAFDELPEFSARYPTVTFLWVDADCVGGTCLYSGYGCRCGQVLARQEAPTRDGLGTLVQILGIELGPEQFFLPFTRGFFRL
jgi:hypothetical protein